MIRKDLLRRLLTYTGRAKGLIVLSVFSAIVYSLCAMFIPFFAGKAIDALMPSVDFEVLKKNVFIIAVLVIVASAFQYVLNVSNNRISYGVTRRLRNDAYEKTGKVPVSYIDSASAGSVQSMLISDCETVGDGMILFLNQFFSGITAIVFTLGIMLFVEMDHSFQYKH